MPNFSAMFQERGWWGAVVLAVVLLLPSAALAQGTPDNGAATSEKELDSKARTSYRLGEFDAAIKAWKEAYRVSSNAVYLYNIAQAYRRKQDFKQSIFFYKQYLNEAPEAPNRADVEAHIAEMKKNLEEAAATKEAPPEEPLTTGGTTTTGSADTSTSTAGTPTTGTAGTTPSTRSPRDDTGASPGRGLRYAGLGAGVVGVALLGTSVVFALKASSAQSDVEAARENAEPWSEELQDRFEAGESAASTGKLTLALGGAALVTGGVLFYLGHRSGSQDESSAGARFVPTVSPDGVAASFELSF